MFRHKYLLLLAWLLVIAFVMALIVPVLAQNSSGEDSLQPGQAEIVGVLESFAESTMVVNGQIIDVSNAAIEAGVTVGQMVRIHATSSGANSWIATEVQAVQSGDIAQPQDGQFEITGTLESIDNGFIVIAGQSINIADAQISTSLVVGERLRLNVSLTDGQLSAREIGQPAQNDNDNDNANNNANDNGNDNLNSNDNDNNNLNNNDNDNDNVNVVPAFTIQQVIQRVFEVYPNTIITSIRLESKFGGTLVWEVNLGGSIQLNIDIQTGDILTIEQGNNNANTNANLNNNDNDDNGGDNANNNANSNANVNNNNNDNDDNGGGGNNNDNDNDDNGDDDDDDDNSGMGSDDDDNSGMGMG